MKKLMIGLLVLGSPSVFADYTCYPSKKNEFATEIMKLKTNKSSVLFKDAGGSTGKAKFKTVMRASQDRFVTFDNNLYENMTMTSSPSGHTGDWFGEGYGQMYIGHSILRGEERGRMAIAWCYHWCNYDYFTCASND